MEQWKDIRGFEGLYKISNMGRIWSVRKNREKIPDLNNCGYKRIQLIVNKVRSRFFIHRLVAEHFLYEPSLGRDVNHKNLNKQDNRFFNLEWVTKSENSKHAHANGHQPGAFVKKPCELVYPGGIVERYDSVRDCAEAIGYCKSSLYNYMRSGKAVPSIGAHLRSVQ